MKKGPIGFCYIAENGIDLQFNFDNAAAQRNLNEKGKALARSLGDALRQVEHWARR
jgi:hypothetical protein